MGLTTPRTPKAPTAAQYQIRKSLGNRWRNRRFYTQIGRILQGLPSILWLTNSSYVRLLW